VIVSKCILPDAGLNTHVGVKWYQRLGPNYLENIFIQPLIELIASNGFCYRLARGIYNRLHYSRIHRINHLNALKRLECEDASGYDLESEFGYAGDVFWNELVVAHNYRRQILDDFPSPSESKLLYRHILTAAENRINCSGAKIFFNFGVSYAYTDSILAKIYPEVKFVGIERTPAAKMYNNYYLAGVDNLEILDGDIFEVLKNRNFEGGIFFHSRTLLLLPQEFILSLYKAVKNAGFHYVLGAEQYGISRQTGRCFSFSYDYQKSVVYRDFMYTHNYPQLLDEAGFDLIRMDSIKTEHPHEDYRILSFEAEVRER
jgi:hypothetical protein